ncbi:MAG: family 16 glycosylhydrolase [Pseudomonadota bacterium]
MLLRVTPVAILALGLCASCGQPEATESAIETDSTEHAETEPTIEEPVEPEIPALPPIHPPLQSNQAFLIDFTQQEVGEGWYVADHDVPTGQWKNDFRASSVSFSEEGMDLSIQIKEDWAPDDWFWDASEVSTNPTFHFGYYEVEMKVADGSGLVSAMFTYTGPFYGTVHDEVDIEFVGNRTGHVEFNVFRSGKSYGSKRHELDFDASEEFHFYGFDWQPDYVHWYVNGEIVHRLDVPEHVPQLPSKIMMNMWTGSLPQWHGHAQFEPGAKAQYRCLSFSPGTEKTPTCRDRELGG